MIAVVAGFVGLVVGSFLNVVVYRVPLGKSLVTPGSACPACGASVRPLDNVPILSYAILRGRCRACGARISPRYPVIELLTGALFAAAFVRFERPAEAAFAAVAGAVLLALAFIDLEHRRVPNKIVLPATAAAALWVGVMGWVLDSPSAVVSSLGSAVAGFGFMFVVAVVSGGMGFGDVKLAAFIGVVVGWFGWSAFVLALFSGFVIGGVISIGLLVARKRGRKDAIPFAPMLCSGALVGLFAGGGPVATWLAVTQVSY